MPKVYPSGRVCYVSTIAGLAPEELPGIEVSGRTLGEVLLAFEQTTGARVVPNPDEAKYFCYTAVGAEHPVLIDIHIFREGQECCAKQDLGFAVCPDDQVVFGMLAC